MLLVTLLLKLILQLKSFNINGSLEDGLEKYISSEHTFGNKEKNEGIKKKETFKNKFRGFKFICCAFILNLTQLIIL